MALPKKLLSIDIGNERIKIAHISKNKNKVKLLNSIVVPTPRNSIKDGVISNKDEISSAIKNALVSEKIKEKNVVFTISSSKVITREVELPYLKPKKLASVIKLNAEEYFPVNLAEYTLDYTITDIVEAEDGKKAKIIVFAAMKSVVNMYIEVAEICKLKVQSIDYSGNSVVSFIQNEKLEGTNLFLDIGAESTMVVIMSNNVVKFSRNLLFGTKLLNDSIMNHFEVDYEEATKISKERQLINVDHKENTNLANDIAGGMEQILTGVSRLVDYYSSRNKNQVEKIYLLGGGAEIYGIEEYVEQFFNIKTSKLVALKSVKDKSYKKVKDFQLYFVAAIGATIESINLLPAQIKNKKLNKAKERIPYMIVVLLIVALAAFYYMQYNEYRLLVDQKTEIQYEIDSMADIKVIQEEYNAILIKKDFREQLDEISTTKSDMTLKLINQLEKSMPENTFISNMGINTLSISFDFTSLDEATVGRLLTYLKGVEGEIIDGETYPLFENVYTNEINRTGNPDENGVSYVETGIVCKFYVMEVE